MEKFMNGLINELNGKGSFNVSMTENGAIGYRTSGKNLLDLNFAVSSLRNADDAKIINMFTKAYHENPMYALKWLFYARDVREGLGERRLFRTVIKNIAFGRSDIINQLITLIPEYGRFDDLMVLMSTKLEDRAVSVIREQLAKDIENKEKNRPISLLGKWLPSINASSKEKRKMALRLADKLGLDKKTYRVMLSELRAYTNVVETNMSSNKWDKINYEHVPSRANMIYRNAFMKHDPERRQEFLDSVSKGESKINSSVNYPHDIVNKYYETYYWGSISGLKSLDTSLEALWKALPDYVQGDESTIVVADGSGSMTSRIGKSSVTALSVANALAIYFAERCKGIFKDKYITFSRSPQLVDLSNGKTLRDKIKIALAYDEVANTNIEAVFKLILNTAISNNMKQKELPKNILIISDMEFDSCASYSIDARLFDSIEKNYEAHGYKLPRLVFWNVNSRTGTIPVIENDLGIALVSGFSPTITKMVLSNQTDPYLLLLETLNSDRYKPIEEALKNII